MLFDGYNSHHRHSGIAYLTPACVHAGIVDEVTVAPRVWINNPEDKVAHRARLPVAAR